MTAHAYERRVVRVDVSPMNPKMKCAQLACGHDVWRNRAPRIGALIVCEQCSKEPTAVRGEEPSR